MRKISTILAGVLLSMVLFSSVDVYASLNPTDIQGHYIFSAKIDLKNNDFADILLNNNTVTIAAAGSEAVTLENFVYKCTRRAETGGYDWIGSDQIEIQYNNLDGNYSSALPYYFADADGKNWDNISNNIFHFLLTQDSSGNFTSVPFTVVSVQNGVGTIIASYTDVVLTLVDQDQGDTFDFAGSYTVTGTKTTYSNGSLTNPTVENNASFDMVIQINPEDNTSGDVSLTFDQFAGYDNITALNEYGSGMYATVNENTATIFSGQTILSSYSENSNYYSVILGGPDIDLGDDNEPLIDNDARISLSYSNGIYTLGDFTVWLSKVFPSPVENTILTQWSNLTVTPKQGGNFVEKIETTTSSKVVAGNGVINILGDYKQAKIYNISGISLSDNAGFTTVVNPGVYVVWVDGMTSKVIVK